MGAGDPRWTQAWRRLRAMVITEEPYCTIGLPGICTQVSTTADHIVSVADRPDLALIRSNVRGACGPCNYSRGASEGNRKRGRVNIPRRWAI